MKKHLTLLFSSLSLLCFTLSPVSAFASDPVKNTIEEEKKPEFRMSQLGDVNLTCGQLSREALRMRGIIHRKQSIKDDTELKDHGINAAGAVGSLLLGSVTGGIGLAAAGFIAAQAVEEEAEKAENIRNIAAQRRGFMVGIYNAKGCFGPTEHVMIEPVSKDLATRLAETTPAAGDEKQQYND